MWQMANRKRLYGIQWLAPGPVLLDLLLPGVLPRPEQRLPLPGELATDPKSWFQV